MDPKEGTDESSQQEQQEQQEQQGSAGGAHGADQASDAGTDESSQQEQQEDAQDGNDADGKAGSTVNRHKYERDLAAKDKEIDDLRAQIAAGADTKAGREKLQKQLDDLKADMADKETSYKLELAGCKNAKAGKALLADHDGDIAKLKEAEPWLFEGEKKTGSTGKKPLGTASDLDEKLDRAFGLKK